MTARAQLIGRDFGRWTVVQYSHNNGKGKSLWLCQCECGNTSLVTTSNLTSGTSQSCGCLGAEHRLRASTKHGLKQHPLYNIWKNMKRRCSSPADVSYFSYGGRGIAVCPVWQCNFKVFHDWSLANGYKAGLQLDRYPDNNGHYEPGNCRWATRQENMNNTRRNKKAIYNGQEYALMDLWRLIGKVPIRTAKSRIKAGVDLITAITAPFRSLPTKNRTNFNRSPLA